jgi:hypothetical protein
MMNQPFKGTSTVLAFLFSFKSPLLIKLLASVYGSCTVSFGLGMFIPSLVLSFSSLEAKSPSCFYSFSFLAFSSSFFFSSSACLAISFSSYTSSSNALKSLALENMDIQSL